MDEQATGLILRTRPLTESSLIVHWLTEESGRIATVAKGARRPKSPFRGKLDLFFQARLSFRRSRRGDLHTLREVTLLDTRPALRTDLERLQPASAAVVLVEKSTETDTPIPEIHRLLMTFLDQLDRHQAAPLSLPGFALKLLAALGLAPDENQSGLSPGTRAVLRHAILQDWDALGRLQPSPAQLGELRHFLHALIRHHFHWNPAVAFDALK
jgi:DNA repair protein RecO (recombination protein O)